jgi:diguanylate cyclase (GGDEF)-like protein/PAS domain S-box-containing protein
LIRIAIILAMLYVWAMGKSETHLNLQLRWHHQFQFAGYYAAVHKGFYAQHGLNVTLLEGGADVNSLNSVLSGKADFGVSNSSLVIDYMNGSPVVMLGPIFQHSPNILLTRESLKSPVELARSGSIALMGGDQDVELKAMFLKEGIALNKIRFVSNHNHLDDFVTHKVDAINAYSSNEPFTLKENNISYTILEPRTYGLDFYGDLLFTSHVLYEKSPETVESFRKATMQGWEYALQHQDEIIELILEHYNTQNKTREHLAFEADVLSHLVNPDFVQIGHSNPGRWDHIVQTYELFGMIKQKRPLEPFFYTPEMKQDVTLLYLYVFPALVVAFLFGGIAYYIYRINRRLEKSVSRHRVLFQNSASAGIVWREGYIITDWNAQAEKLFGWKREEVLGRNFFDFLVLPEEEEKVKMRLENIWNDYELHILVNSNRTKKDKVLICEWHNTQLPKNGDDSAESVSLAIDITERQQREDELHHLATHDHLTSLPNRKMFDETLAKTYARSSRYEEIFGVVFIDLDGFKAVNDTYGHDAGDHLLRTLGERFYGVLRREDFLSRLGGDEFAIILVATSDTQTCHKVLNRILEAASTPIFYQKHILNVSASMGVSFYTPENRVETQELLQQADSAMYTAKNKGKNRYHIYES